METTSFGLANLMASFRRLGISSSQSEILFVVHKTEGLSLSEISDLTGLSKSAMTKIIAFLEKNEYLEYESDLNDRRSKFCFLTEKGQQFVEDSLEIARQ